MIRLRFGARPGIEAAFIQWFSMGHWSHVDVVMPDGMLLGARADGVWLRQPGYAPFRNVRLATIPAAPPQWLAFYRFVVDQIGKPYDNLALWAFLRNREWHREDAWTCSELPAAGLVRAGLLRMPITPPSKITPVMLADLIRQIPDATIEAEE